MLTSLAAEKASGQRLRQRLGQSRGFGWWKRRAWGAVAQAEHHQWPNLTLLTDKNRGPGRAGQASAPRYCEEGGRNSEGAETATPQEG